MKKIILFALFVINICAGLYADNIFILTAGIEDKVFKDNQNVRDAVMALESGAMDVYFESGHIISNFGLHHIDAGDALKAAKNAGCSYLMLIEPVFADQDDFSIKSIDYSYVNTISEDILFSDKLETFERTDNRKLEDIYIELGSNMAWACIRSNKTLSAQNF